MSLGDGGSEVRVLSASHSTRNAWRWSGQGGGATGRAERDSGAARDSRWDKGVDRVIKRKWRRTELSEEGGGGEQLVVRRRGEELVAVDVNQRGPAAASVLVGRVDSLIGPHSVLGAIEEVEARTMYARCQID